MYLIELFSGTGSFSSGAEAALPPRWKMKLFSLDVHPKYNPTTCTDILKWKYKSDLDGFLEPAKDSDMIWLHASPPCTEYSKAKTTAPRDLPLADSIAKKTLAILKAVKPDYWTIENPVGLMRTRPFMRPYDKYEKMTSYCKWGKPFRKDTNIWTNVDVELPVCRAGSQCAAKERDGNHRLVAQAFPSYTGATPAAGSGEKIYPLPKRLCMALVRAGLDEWEREGA